MTRKMKPVEVELSSEVQQAVLSLPVRGQEGSLSTVGDLIREAREALDKANAAIHENALIQLTASHLMKQEKRRGNPSILARLDGTAYLRIIYGGEEEVLDTPEPLVQSPKLPNLPSLRKKAAELGVDISDLGRQKKKIMERLEGVTPEDRPPFRLRDEVTESSLSRQVVGGVDSVPSPSR